MNKGTSGAGSGRSTSGSRSYEAAATLRLSWSLDVTSPAISIITY